MSTYTIYVRKFGKKGWVLTDSQGAEGLFGPDRLGNHPGAVFPTMVDAAHAAQWRITELEDGAGHVAKGPAL